MKIIEVDKSLYRKRLNKVIIGFIVIFALMSIGFGSALIALFSEQGVNVSTLATTEGGEQPSNFKYNFLGVVLALLACAAILHSVKSKPFFHEIYYVWQLKQIQNLIYRKLKKIKSAAFDDKDVNAMIVLNYYYVSLKQVYSLDDNTLTMSSVNNDHDKLTQLIEDTQVAVTTEQFDKSLLASF